MSKVLKIEVLNPLRGKYKLPYTTGHVVSLSENVANELIKNKDAKLFVKTAKAVTANKPEVTADKTEQIDVTDPQEETGKEE